MADPLWIIDAHGDYQHGMSVDVLAREGYAALTVKITEGTWYMAPQENFDWIRRDEQLGLIGGGYHFLRAGSGVDQCHKFLDGMNKIGGVTGKLIQLDCEADGYEREITDWLREFWLNAPEHPVLIYSGSWWWNKSTRPVYLNAAALGPVHLWHSHYASGTGFGSVLYEQVADSWWIPGYGGFDVATMLQFTPRATAGTITGNVDVSAFRGTRDELLALTKPGGKPSVDRSKDMPFMAHVKNSNSEYWLVGDGVFSRGIVDWTEHENLVGAGIVQKEFTDDPTARGYVGRVDADEIVTTMRAIKNTQSPTLDYIQLAKALIKEIGTQQ